MMDNIREKLAKLIEESRIRKTENEGFCICGSHIIADHLLANGVTVQEWISVDERLPDDNDRVIAFRPNEPETSAYKYCVMWGWSVKASLKHRGITHWCEMPQPPKGE